MEEVFKANQEAATAKFHIEPKARAEGRGWEQNYREKNRKSDQA